MTRVIALMEVMSLVYLQPLDSVATTIIEYIREGTGACPNQSFYCQNEGHIGSFIPSSRVRDGLCGVSNHVRFQRQ